MKSKLGQEGNEGMRVGESGNVVKPAIAIKDKWRVLFVLHYFYGI